MDRLQNFAIDRAGEPSRPGRFRRFGNRLVKSRAAYGLIFGLSIGPLVGLLMGAGMGVTAGIGYGIYNSMVLTIDFILLGRLDKEVRPTEMMRWSNGAARRAVARLGWIAGGIGVVASLFFGGDAGVASVVLLGLVFALTNIGIAGLLGGITHQQLDNRRFESPNEGVWRSARYGALFGILGGCTVGLAVGLTLGLLVDPIAGSSAGLSSAISAGEIIGLRTGGFVWFHHMTIRFLLWRCRCIPWNYTRFLNHAVDLTLLQRAGGAYEFPHRLLLEHFASARPSSTRRR